MKHLITIAAIALFASCTKTNLAPIHSNYNGAIIDGIAVQHSSITGNDSTENCTLTVFVNGNQSGTNATADFSSADANHVAVTLNLQLVDQAGNIQIDTISIPAGSTYQQNNFQMSFPIINAKLISVKF